MTSASRSAAKNRSVMSSRLPIGGGQTTSRPPFTAPPPPPARATHPRASPPPPPNARARRAPPRPRPPAPAQRERRPAEHPRPLTEMRAHDAHVVARGRERPDLQDRPRRREQHLVGRDRPAADNDHLRVERVRERREPDA